MGRVWAYLMALPVLAVFVLPGQAEDPCELRTLSSEVHVLLGERVSLNCTFNCSGRASWKTRLLKKDTQWGPNWVSVEVLVDDWEKSEMYCIQSLDDGNIRQSLAVVMAYAVPSNVTIDLDQELEEGKVHKVICIVYDVAPVENLQIQLLRADTVIHNSTFKGDGRKGKQTVNVTYEVVASRMDNLQNFSCLARLEVATGAFIVSSSKTIRTYGPPDAPVVTIRPESDIQEGDSFDITCLSHGSPSPEYHWIVPTGADVTYNRNNSVVSVIRAGQIHNGNYTCEARNIHGRVRGSKNVRVIPLTKGPSRKHTGDIISAVLVFIVTSLILWKTRIWNRTPRDSN
ncbi:vascular cell adhesion protein 1-like [Leptodactylus fuscus]|uniref:vascular cell adhesion protein 1-like n=1 Tax=Leptodactylus fuscus TaxID=238119 RepID=UPI003F4F2597